MTHTHFKGFSFHVSMDEDGDWSAIVQDTRPGQKRYYISGHGEHPLTALHECLVALHTAMEIFNE